MKTRQLNALLVAVLVLSPAAARPALLTAAVSARADVVTPAALFRVFLKDGTALVSYGEVARVGDRVVFSMPLLGQPDASADVPPLHLVNLPLDRVDWSRTTAYAESARVAHYLEYQAAFDYIALSNAVAQTLQQVAATKEPGARLAMVDAARKRLAAWPAAHYNFKEAEVRQMVGFLDGAIADLQSSGGNREFALNFVTPAPAPPRPVPQLPRPTDQQLLELSLAAARASDVPADRQALLTAVVDIAERADSSLPAAWVARTIAAANSALATEARLDQAYRAMASTALDQARRLARRADVRGIQRVLEDVRSRDARLGSVRPGAVRELTRVLDEQLETARALRLAREHWALRLPELHQYRSAIDLSLIRFKALEQWLEDIKAMSGSSTASLTAIRRTAERITKSTAAIAPPDELQPAHAMLASAAHLAQEAAAKRAEAAASASLPLARDASAAAAGALMLGNRARAEIEALVRRPQIDSPLIAPLIAGLLR